MAALNTAMRVFRRSVISRYFSNSAISSVLSLTIPVVLHDGFGLHEHYAVAISLLFVFSVNFVVLRKFVFRSTNSARSQFVVFAFSRAAFRGAEYLAWLVLFEALAIDYFVALVFVLGVSTIAKFFVDRLIFVKIKPGPV